MCADLDTQEWACWHKAVVDGLRAGKTLPVVAREIGVRFSTLYDWCRHWRVPTSRKAMLAYDLAPMTIYPDQVPAIAETARRNGLAPWALVDRILVAIDTNPALISTVIESTPNHGDPQP